ncbi:hypothetical protein [Brevibacillus daliensis]|uniref:hypothetical protein n=1 Tax=Brevibacillus daliensis TaxID=2892995 RepID=UPI001E3B586E|nr:hypothetical protein [Brevibacillus daliensis]
MSNVYVQAREIFNNVSSLTGFTPSNFDIVRSQEHLLERLCVMSVNSPTIKDIVRSSGLDIKKLASSKISQVTASVLSNKTAQDVQLVNLFPLTNEVFDKIKSIPTVMKICGDPDNQVDVDVHSSDRMKFMHGLALFVGRQILVVKYKIGEILDGKVHQAVELFLDAYDGTRGMFTAFHQIANKLVAGGLDKDEAKSALVEVSQEKVERLASFVRASFGGYMARVTDSIRENSSLLKGA